MKLFLPAIVAIALSLGGTAAAQTPAGDAGLGEKLGIQQLNNSGQIGDITLFNRGAKTSIRIVIDGAPAGRTQSATIHRGRDCDMVEPKALYRLSDLKNGRSTSSVEAPLDKLMSGNYSVLIYGGTHPTSHAVACGHLYR